MWKIFTLILLAVIGAICVSSSPIDQSKEFEHLNSDVAKAEVDIDLCPECIGEAVQVINILLNLVLDEGIIQSCDALCGALANKTDSPVIGDFCLAVCDAYGIDEFVKALIRADIDPIWYCEIIDLCPVNDHGDAKFINFDITPKSAPEGSTFIFDCSFMSVNGTGTGTIVIDFIDPKNRSVSNLYWFEARKPGTYPEKIHFDSLSELDCDSSKDVCDGWPIGTYNVTTRVCNGECGSQHPHSSTYDTVHGSFEITKKQSFL